MGNANGNALKPQTSPEQKSKGTQESSHESLATYKCKHVVNKDGVTFFPSPHLPSEKDICTKKLDMTPFLKSQRLRDIQGKVKWAELEAVSDWDAQIVDDCTSNISPFIMAAVKAFNEHYPLKLSPNHIFLMVLQAMAIHVDEHSEKLRDKFVSHEGKVTLSVERFSETFILREQCRTNDWDAVIAEFEAQIDKATVADTAKLMRAEFSDSSAIDVVANQITVMDICKNYFEYEFVCVPGCGFPKITLCGTKHDWVLLRKKVDALLSSKVDKKWGHEWATALLPVLDRFVGAFDGDIDCLFWNSMCKSGVTVTELDSSAGPMYTRDYWFSGWFNVFFPFICTDDGRFVANKYCTAYSADEGYAQGGAEDAGKEGNDVKVYPLGLSSAPVKTHYEKESGETFDYQMKFMAGMLGYAQ